MSTKEFQMLPTPPESHRSPRATRGKLYSSAESTASTQSTGSITIDVTSEFRQGTPAPLRAWPLCTKYISPKSPISMAYQPIKYDVHHILRDLEIDYSTVDLVQRWEPGKSPTAADVTILIMAEQGAQHWQAALNDIQTLIISNNLPFMRLEIMTEEARFFFFLPTSDTALENIWASSLRARVLDTLGLAGQWQSMTILNRGHTQETSVPTVTVELTEAADQLWQQVVYQNVLDILEDYPGLVDKHIAFVRPSSLSIDGGNPSPTALPIDAFSGPVPMGSSIGVESSTGTIGGYVDVRFQGKVYTMGLTSHRVVENDSMTADQKANGLSPDLTRPVMIDAPSAADRAASVQCFENLRDKNKDTLYGPLVEKNKPSGPRIEESGLAFKVRYGNPSRIVQENYDDMIGEIKALGDDINRVRHADIRFGSVFASSGTGRYYGSLEPHQIPWAKKSQETGNAIDWALIHVSDHARIGGNMIAQELKFDRSFRALGQTITEAQLTDIKPGTKLFREGQNGTSMGTVSGYTAELLVKERTYRAAVVMPANLDRKEEFLYGGDSGSFCMNNLGTFCALGFAGNDETGAGYVIPASWIYKDVRARTGAVIENPSPEA